MKSMSSPLLALLALTLVAPSANGFQRTFHLEDELQWAQRDYLEGTNCMARGMFREAEARIGGSISNVTRRLRETEQRARTVEPLQGFFDRLQAVRDGFDDNWTNAVSEVLALEEPLRAFLSTNAVVQPGLNWRMEVFERLRTKVETGDKTGASDDLKAFQIGLRREIESYERLHGLESAFRSVLADLERARDKLETERAKPFDPQNRADGNALSTERSDGGRP